MYEVAAVSVDAVVVVFEATALFSFVFGVHLIVLPQLV